MKFTFAKECKDVLFINKDTKQKTTSEGDAKLKRREDKNHHM